LGTSPIGVPHLVATNQLLALAAHEPAEELLAAPLVAVIGGVEEIESRVPARTGLPPFFVLVYSSVLMLG
jgi:hypothetical protein